MHVGTGEQEQLDSRDLSGETRDMGIPARHENGLEISIIANLRSGHHAIAQWLSHQISQPVCFLNLVVPYLDPFLSARDPTRFGRTGRFMPYEDSIEDIERVRLCRKQGLLIDYQDIPLPV